MKPSSIVSLYPGRTATAASLGVVLLVAFMGCAVPAGSPHVPGATAGKGDTQAPELDAIDATVTLHAKVTRENDAHRYLELAVVEPQPPTGSFVRVAGHAVVVTVYADRSETIGRQELDLIGGESSRWFIRPGVFEQVRFDFEQTVTDERGHTQTFERSVFVPLDDLEREDGTRVSGPEIEYLPYQLRSYDLRVLDRVELRAEAFDGGDSEPTATYEFGTISLDGRYSENVIQPVAPRGHEVWFTVGDKRSESSFEPGPLVVGPDFSLRPATEEDGDFGF